MQVDASATLEIITTGVLTDTGSSTVAGNLYLQNGGTISTTGGLSITGTGRLAVDAPYSGGGNGSSLTIAGVLTNNSTDDNALDIGNAVMTSGDTVTATGLSNTGEINILGAAGGRATLAVNGAATTSGIVNIGANSEILMGAGTGIRRPAAPPTSSPTGCWTQPSSTSRAVFWTATARSTARSITMAVAPCSAA